MATTKKRVLVALSGGVDSSVSAALLQEQGYEVEGAFIVTWTAPWLPCTWREERLDAMRVAASLGILFHTVDLSKEYERDVVQYMVREYQAGRTPNPDIMCNKHIKFGAFFAWAMEQGFDCVATGHYARVVAEIRNSKNENRNKEEIRKTKAETGENCASEIKNYGRDGGVPTKLQAIMSADRSSRGRTSYKLLCGRDTQKDQSYFLYTLTQHHLAHTLFPVGGYEKPHVRELAEKFGLPTAQKKDSQGVCFLGQIDMKDFLQHYLPKTPGDVLDSVGTVIGCHEGAMFYTLGQRHGFEVSAQSPDAEPLYVVAKDVTRNTITVATRVEDVTKQGVQSVYLSEINWIARTPPTSYKLSCPQTDPPTGGQATSLLARFRYRQTLIPVTVTQDAEGRTLVTFGEPQSYVPTGQSLVLYDGDECLGGGVIEDVVVKD